jgi:hypothetical protein
MLGKLAWLFSLTVMTSSVAPDILDKSRSSSIPGACSSSS